MSDNGSDPGLNPDDDENHNTEETLIENPSDYEASSPESETSFHSAQTGEPSKKRPEKSYKPPPVKPLKTQYSEAYRSLYNDTVEDISYQSISTIDDVQASQIGLTTWESTEKRILFQKVASLGKDNIKDIAAAIGTKSETEVRQYILLLDQGLVEGNLTYSLPTISAPDIPAAFEVSKQSEDVLEEFADGLSQYQQKNDQKREKKKFGDYWLLTQEIAAEIEEKVEAYSEIDDDKDSEDENKSESQVDKPTGTDDGEGEEEGSKAQKDDLDDELEVPAAKLLNLPTWLQLSQLFMYQSQDSEENWNNYITTPEETPSIQHTTFQDFHNLTVSLTRRLVQASIFQAMTRLRARDKVHPSAVVTSKDVRAVTDMLDLKRDRHQFFGLLPRKHGLAVYERGNKTYKKGQTRSGVKLSLEAAEEKLGVGKSPMSVQKTTNEEPTDTVENEDQDEGEDPLDPDQYYDDSELWSEISHSDEELVPQHQTIAEDEEPNFSSDAEDSTYRPANNEEAEEVALKKRRKKGQPKRALQKAQEMYLEAFDREMSRVEEVHLWDALKIALPIGIKDEEIEIPQPPILRKREHNPPDWREDVQFEAQWERGSETVQEEDFIKMQERGERGRKRRRLAYEHLEEEGRVVLTRVETDMIQRKPRQELNMMDTSEEPQVNAGALQRQQSQSRVGNRNKGSKNYWGRRGSRSLKTPLPQSVQQDHDRLSAQLSKRLAEQSRGDMETEAVKMTDALEESQAVTQAEENEAPQSRHSPSLADEGHRRRSSSFQTATPRNSRDNPAIQVAQKLAEQAREKKEMKKAEKEEARRVGEEKRSRKEEDMRKSQEAQGTRRITRPKRKSGF